MTDTSNQYCVVLVTAASQEQAEQIAEILLTTKLAACVNITSVKSIYTWQGKLTRDREWQLIIKTELARFDSIAAKITEIHSYEIPEIIALPIINGSKPYLDWISSSLT